MERKERKEKGQRGGCLEPPDSQLQSPHGPAEEARAFKVP